MLLLPGTLIAGVLGMNFQVGLFGHAWLFWVAIGAIAALAAATQRPARASGSDPRARLQLGAPGNDRPYSRRWRCPHVE
jgi:hypothetical protein